jgi:hypothetical protein
LEGEIGDLRKKTKNLKKEDVIKKLNCLRKRKKNPRKLQPISHGLFSVRRGNYCPT